jgi:predicted nucleic acid-binding protein
MMIYMDTSVLVSALTSERATAASQAWLQAQNPDDLAISDWTAAEFSAALSIKARIGAMTANERASVLAEFVRLSARNRHDKPAPA